MYKRQVVGIAEQAGIVSHDEGGEDIQKPVSYTHLDVYKRQIQHLFYYANQFEITVGAIRFLCHVQCVGRCN